MTYRLDYVLALAEERNLTKAAQKLYISQPTLTKYITRLEQDLGVQLFDRSVQPIRITRAGQVFIEDMQKIQTRETNLRTKLKAISRDADSFSIGIPTIRAEYLLPEALPEFLEEYPHVSISTDPRIESAVEGAVAAGELDVAVGALTLAYDELEYSFLKEDEVLLLLSREHPAVSGITAGEFALRLARCGAETTIKRVPGAGHAFTIYRREGHEVAFELMVRYLRSMLNLK